MLTVGVPVYNEEANIGSLLEVLTTDSEVDQIVVVDDGSTDSSPRIIEAFAARSSKVAFLKTAGRCGQLEGWLIAARHAASGSIAYIDADAMPDVGAIGLLGRALDPERGRVLVSGRVSPMGPSASVPASRFSSAVLHAVRLQGHVKEAIIGRFFAVDVRWFLQNVDRADIIANDTYLSCKARRQGLEPLYLPTAVCYFTGATLLKDVAAQRQRADAGYRQLAREGLLRSGDGATVRSYMRAIVPCAFADPVGAASWAWGQLRARRIKAYKTRGNAGTWETQSSTKRRIAKL